ncbi:FAD-dependent oxidoreductase [Actinoplanes sp. NPDC026619]|uniref:NAD(P)/FAD-dependent oxidoreductase n=1 Tax=Actinoplanes sp. NPDC026619 TaxID=3155798 RepID=UPI0033D97D7E
MNRIVIVGASAAGLAAAETLRRSGFGGTITLIGKEIEQPYDRPPLSKQILSSQWEPDRLTLRSADQIRALDLDLRLGVTATGLDVNGRLVHLAGGVPALGAGSLGAGSLGAGSPGSGLGVPGSGLLGGLSGGGPVSFDGLIVATGVRPRRLPGTAAHVLRTVDDVLALRRRLGPGRRLAVVGAGFLGAEAAAVARGLGCEVVLLEPAPVPLAHAVGADVGRVLSEVHREHGVDLRTGVAVAEVCPGGVRLAGGELVEADDVLVAIGSRPNTEWLDGGLSVDDGLVCDEFLAAAPGIYGAGDVVRWPNPLFGGESMRIEHRTNAAEQGMAAARNLLSSDPAPFAPVPYFWSDQYDLKIQAYGYLRGHDRVEIVEGSLEERRFLAAYHRDGRLVGVLAIGISPRTIREWRQAIAARKELA